MVECQVVVALQLSLLNLLPLLRKVHCRITCTHTDRQNRQPYASGLCPPRHNKSAVHLMQQKPHTTNNAHSQHIHMYCILLLPIKLSQLHVYPNNNMHTIHTYTHSFYHYNTQVFKLSRCKIFHQISRGARFFIKSLVLKVGVKWGAGEIVVIPALNQGVIWRQNLINWSTLSIASI